MKFAAVLTALFACGVPVLRGEAGDDLALGRKLFEMHCAMCHGPAGEGGKGPTLAQPSLPRASTEDALRRIIRGGIGGTEMPSFRFEPAQLGAIAAFVRSLGQRPPERVPGDAAHGAQLFATKGACAQCHSLHGVGGAIGPDLTEIGRSRSAAYLRRALVEPAADVPQSFSAYRSDVNLPENFLIVRVKTLAGEALAGVRVNEDTFSIQLRDLAGRVHSFFKADLAELNKDWGQSPMPPYGGVFTPDELNDVIAFLVAQRGKAPVAEVEPTNKTNTVFH